MPRIPVPMGEWRPDIALLDSQFATDVENVFPGLTSYKPIPSLLPFTASALPAPALGLTAVRKSDGTWKVYAGTQTRLYSWALAGWTDVSRLAGGNYNVPATGGLWSFAQFGTKLYACSGINDDLQVIDVESGTNFALAPGSPPRATIVKQLGDFLVLAGLVSNNRKIIWCAINDPTGWTIGTNLCDEQEFPDGGPVQGVAGDTIGYVLQDRCIRTMQFLPGDTTYIFNFTKVLLDHGCVSPYGYTTVGNVLYFVDEAGFFALNGAQVFTVGQDKVNEWWRSTNNSDESRRNVIQCVAANRPYVMWAFHTNSSTPTYNMMLIYDWSLQKWSRAALLAFVYAQLATVPLDLDTTGPETGDADLDSAARSLDSFAYAGGRPKVAAINENGFLCTLDGPNLPALLETIEAHLVPGRRAFVSDAYPRVDAAACTISVATRERLQDPIMWQSPTPLEITGSASILSSGRLQRFRVTVPAGDIWTHGQGVDVEAQSDGEA